MPQQVSRLLVAFLLAGTALAVARHFLVPDTFGDLGHYRAAALDSIASHEKKYAGREECALCHGAIEAARAASNHRGVTCEVCHGPAADHASSPLEVKPDIPRERALCTLCHSYMPSRPTGFPQIDPDSHNSPAPCVACHEPHSPEPPVAPGDCGACHGQIARQKAVSHHASLPCTTCHEAPEQHKVSPRTLRPTRPAGRSFCGGCHAQEAMEGTGIPQVDLVSHGERYLCWQCHYPHFPEISS
ncbi:hypothetical protein ACFL3S_08375 [Gemmatimonadota bacterium]